jgi:hypothetical protein
MRHMLLAAVLLLAPKVSAAQEQRQGYLLSVWAGRGTAQTHAITAFEGPNARTRCEAAAAAMRNHHPHFNSLHTTCIPF